MASNFCQRLTSYLGPIAAIKTGIKAMIATVWNAVRTDGIGALFGATNWRDEEFALWYRKANWFILPYERSTEIPGLIASADGTVLELGPGLGNQIPLFDQTKVSHMYGIEINGAFVPDLQAKVAECGLDERYTIIHSSAGDTDVLEKHGIKPGTVDTIVSIQVFCSADQPEAVAREMYQLLKPGGKFIFWEHHVSHDYVTRIFQNIWNFPWSYFIGGCKLNRDTMQAITSAGKWENIDSIEGSEKDQPWSLTPRIWGVLVKA
ncbi:S-adenosyl-L-methionine-dependent methyltransferase [Hypoxylon sp. FL1284]|nr:S-adenosyl-L-methionine-dependent methyltransferase [Hypoxylon sp. FL1284]